MSKATDELLSTLHGLLAEDMANALREGGVGAAQWSAIAKFLKDNGIQAIPTGDTDNPLDALMKAAQESLERSGLPTQ